MRLCRGRAAHLRLTAPFDPRVLVGTWTGGGAGSYPTIEPFTYSETVTVATVPHKPFLTYTQRTAHPDTGAPMHAEVGYLRIPPAPPATDATATVPASQRAELTIAQPTGITECHEGTLEVTHAGTVIDLATTSVGRTPSAREVTSVRRRLVFDGDVLTYELWMAAVGQPDTLHLRAKLHRQPAD